MSDIPVYTVEHNGPRGDWDVVRRLPDSNQGRVIATYAMGPTAGAVAHALNAHARYEVR